MAHLVPKQNTVCVFLGLSLNVLIKSHQLSDILVIWSLASQEHSLYFCLFQFLLCPSAESNFFFTWIVNLYSKVYSWEVKKISLEMESSIISSVISLRFLK